jgi:hypothetical protein
MQNTHAYNCLSKKTHTYVKTQSQNCLHKRDRKSERMLLSVKARTDSGKGEREAQTEGQRHRQEQICAKAIANKCERSPSQVVWIAAQAKVCTCERRQREAEAAEEEAVTGELFHRDAGRPTRRSDTEQADK